MLRPRDYSVSIATWANEVHAVQPLSEEQAKWAEERGKRWGIRISLAASTVCLLLSVLWGLKACAPV
jgi:hypothetical protein